MNRKTIIVTGGTGGIGLSLVKRLAQMDNKIFIIGKNEEKGKKAILETSSPGVEFFKCDLSEKKEINKFLKEINSVNKIDLLVNNAGALFLKREVNSENVEKNFSLNHISYFQMSLSLIEKLKKSNNPKIINITSNAHKMHSLDLEDLENKKNYGAWKAYCRSKLLNIYFTYEFNRKTNTNIICNCVHPGFVNSDFGNNNNSIYRAGIKIIKKLFAISTDKSSSFIYNLCEDDLKKNSENYFYKGKVKKSSNISYDRKIADFVWKESLKYIS